MQRSRTGALAGCGLAALLALGSVSLTPSAFAATADQSAITIAAISDFHGHIENASQLKYQLDQVKASSDNFMFVGNGDLVGGSAYVSSIANDSPTISILGQMGLQVSGAGNHEFDKGYADFRDRIIPEAATAGYHYTLASVDGVDPSVLPPYYILTTNDGVSVAFVSGVTDELPTLVSPAGIKGLTPTQDQDAINRVAAQLKDGNAANGEADVVVALDHSDSANAAKIGPNVDAVVAGHTHLNAETTTASGAPVVEPESYGTAFGEITITYDKATKKATATGKVNHVKDQRDKNGMLPDGSYDATIEQAYQDAKANAEKLGAAQVGTIKGVANRGTDSRFLNDTGANRGTESSLGNLVAEGFYQYSQSLTNKADFGITNAGGLRADLDPNGDGVITLEESYTQMPFGNSFGTRSVTGAQVYEMLEQQWKNEPNASRPILRLGLSKNIYYTYDPAAEYGHHVTGVYLNGKAIDPNATYTIASAAFLLAGGDGFDALAEGTDFVDTGIIDNDAFNAFLAATPDVRPDYSQHSIGITGADTLQPGKKATLKLASLSMTSTEPLGNGVAVYLNGTQVASTDLDNTVTPQLDETGTGTVSFTVPADAPEASQLRIVTGTLLKNGTVVDPITDVTANVTVKAAASEEPTGEPTSTPTTKPAAASSAPNAFNADADGNFTVDKVAAFGKASDTPLMGDWDGDGVATPAVQRGNVFMLKNSFAGGKADVTFAFGKASDAAIAGDFDGDGKDSIAVRRGSQVFVQNKLAGGEAAFHFVYGKASDAAIAGDFDGDGKDSIAVRRGSQVFVQNKLAGGEADKVFVFGRTGDQAVAGDFDGDGKDTVAVVRGNKVFLNNKLAGGVVAGHTFGASNATFFAGDFNADGVDTIAYHK
ncbi:bifunctional metallophosphatase/5'-nucleotidase [Neoactinobaculum massilliense]|uniref:bifunctional metallophosphatase/5'-nucleotidase n=1 Tax=Neoactinobaculum massilliense TaxID=2364794 RepID=UPI000F5288C0|nr:bifunctional UDP-sugar hydrolase/5'-nucleotidase [Neoactinobaculum massilliense]